MMRRPPPPPPPKEDDPPPLPVRGPGVPTGSPPPRDAAPPPLPGRPRNKSPSPPALPPARPKEPEQDKKKSLPAEEIECVYVEPDQEEKWRQRSLPDEEEDPDSIYVEADESEDDLYEEMSAPAAGPPVPSGRPPALKPAPTPKRKTSPSSLAKPWNSFRHLLPRKQVVDDRRRKISAPVRPMAQPEDDPETYELPEAPPAPRPGPPKIVPVTPRTSHPVASSDDDDDDGWDSEFDEDDGNGGDSTLYITPDGGHVNNQNDETGYIDREDDVYTAPDSEDPYEPPLETNSSPKVPPNKPSPLSRNTAASGAQNSKGPLSIKDKMKKFVTSSFRGSSRSDSPNRSTRERPPPPPRTPPPLPPYPADFHSWSSQMQSNNCLPLPPRLADNLQGDDQSWLPPPPDHLINRSLKITNPPPPEDAGEIYTDGTSEHPLTQFPWFHETVDAKEAQRRVVSMRQEGAFLVRPSQSGGAQIFVLVVLSTGDKINNLRINERRDGQFAIGSEKPDEMRFRSVDALINYHLQHNITLTNGGSVMLSKAAPKR